jgi:hypothetical protein
VDVGLEKRELERELERDGSGVRESASECAYCVHVHTKSASAKSRQR